MISIGLLVVGVCLAKGDVKTSFDLRQNCLGRHLNNIYVAVCNGSSSLVTQQQDIYIDRRSTTGMSELNLASFRSVTLDTTVHVGRVNIKDIVEATLYLNHSHLRTLTVERVENLTLIHTMSDGFRDSIESLTLNNVKKLQLLSEGSFTWAIDSVKLRKVEDVDFESFHVNIFTKEIRIEDSNMRLSGKSSLMLKAVSATIDKCSLYIHEQGSLNSTVDHFLIKDSYIYLTTGTIHLTNSKEVLFLNNSFYGFGKQSLQLFDTQNVTFMGNEMMNNDVGGVLSLRSDNVTFYQNKFGCLDCSIKSQLLDSDLGDAGDDNYCYVGCNLTLNYFKTLLENRFFCDGESQVKDETVCAVYYTVNNPSEFITNFDLLRLLLFITITVVLIVSLVMCVCHKDNRNKLKVVLRNNVLPQDLGCEGGTQRREQAFAFKNNSFDNICNIDYDNIENLYEPVEQLPVTCR